MKKIINIPFLILMSLILIGCSTSEHNWEKYTDSQHRFEFKYIKNSNSFVASDGRSSGLVFSIQKDGIEAMYGKFEEKNTNIPYCGDGLKNLGTVNIGGIAANKCKNPKDTAGPAWTAILDRKTSNSNGTYKISCSGERTEFELYCEKILATFKFTN